jgi:hypothetical protein
VRKLRSDEGTDEELRVRSADAEELEEAGRESGRNSELKHECFDRTSTASFEKRTGSVTIQREVDSDTYERNGEPGMIQETQRPPRQT